MKNLFFLFLVFFSSVFVGQQKQPKIGLVLSGGGAKGFAHIGILKEIDKAGIQLDYIGGTSMGAIIGGLYAAGYSAIQIEKFILETDFVTLLRDEIPRKFSPFVEKEYGEKTTITLPITKKTIGLPKAVSKGQNVLNLLLELLAPVEKISDFSKLQIPFFCIATDVETGRQILLEKGSLPLALRASGSFPTLLYPVWQDDKLLIDGGIANNFPADIMRAKNIDLIIGVDVQGRLFKKEKLNSALSILNQIVSYQMYNKSNQERNKIDVYIHPEISKFNAVDFDKKMEILKAGNEAGKKYSIVFKEIAAQQKRKKKRKNLVLKEERYQISSIDISGNKNYTRAFVLGKLNIKAGDSITRKEITKRIYLLSATKNYDQIAYTLQTKEDNSHQLNLSLKETKDNATLKIGVHYDLLYKSGVIANYNKKSLLRTNDLFSLDVILGDNLRYQLRYFVDNGFYLSYGFRSRYNHFRANSKFTTPFLKTLDVKNINLKYKDFTNQFFIQTTFGRKFALGLGVEAKKIKASTGTILINNKETIFDNNNYFNAFGYLKLDTYDDKYFPKRGFFADFNATWYLYSSDRNSDFSRFIQAKGTIGFATTIANKFTFQNINEAGFSINSPASIISDFYLGGYNKNYINNFISLYGYDFATLSGDTFLKSEFDFRYNFAENHYITFIANYARLDDNVLKDIDLFREVWAGYAIGYSYNTFLGPIEIKYSWSPDTKQDQWLFNLGFWF